MSKLQWLFFDIGSTLVDESKAYEHRIKDTIADSNITYEHFYETMLNFWRQGKKGDTEVARLFNLKLGKWHSEDEFLYPETHNCLEKLSQKYKIGIIANQVLGTKDRLAKMGILKYIDLIVASAEVGVSKPDLEIFKIAFDRAMCKPEQAVMIGDRLDNDIAPAKQLGMKTVWIRQGFGGLAIPDTDNSPDCAVDNLYEVCELFGE